MKLKIEYEITEFTAEDAADEKHTHDMLLKVSASVYIGLMNAAKTERDRLQRETEEERERWDRFMAFCHTGRILW